MSAPLSPAQETQAQELAALIRQATDEDILAMARLLVATDDQTTFGATEFRLREVVLRAGARAYQTFLAQKKRLPGARDSLPGLRRGRRVQGLPAAHARQPAGPGAAAPRLLPLR